MRKYTQGTPARRKALKSMRQAAGQMTRSPAVLYHCLGIVVNMGLGFRTFHVEGPDEPKRRAGVGGWGGRVTACYEPPEVHEAERRLPFKAVDPVIAVERETRLRLAQVLVQSAPGPRPQPINAIVYVFGTLDDGAIPFPAPAEPKFVVVREVMLPAPPQPIIDRAEGTARRAGGVEVQLVGPWQFRAGLHGGDVLLTVTANMSRETVQRIGMTIIAEDTPGK